MYDIKKTNEIFSANLKCTDLVFKSKKIFENLRDKIPFKAFAVYLLLSSRQ
jgi:hypothetical protein